MKGFIVKKKWADLILNGLKTWEIRGSNCKIRGKVGIVAEDKWIGEVEIIDCLELSLNQYKKSLNKHQVLDRRSLPT